MTSTLNVERMRAVIADITARPETHLQTNFHTETKCGTTECFAGRTVTMFAEPGTQWVVDVVSGVGEMSAWLVTLPDGSEEDAATLAAELLGLTSSQKDALFYNMGGTEHIVTLAEDIIDGRTFEDGE